MPRNAMSAFRLSRSVASSEYRKLLAPCFGGVVSELLSAIDDARVVVVEVECRWSRRLLLSGPILADHQRRNAGGMALGGEYARPRPPTGAQVRNLDSGRLHPRVRFADVGHAP